MLTAIREVCEFRGWELAAAQVRTNHIHVVISAAVKPERVMVDLKIRASTRLNRMAQDGAAATWWSRHGSTRYLWKSESLERAVHYVLFEQGAPMALYARPGLLPDEPSG